MERAEAKPKTKIKYDEAGAHKNSMHLTHLGILEPAIRTQS